MKKEIFNTQKDSFFSADYMSPEELSEENNFLSPEVKPENIFEDQNRDISEQQLSSKILSFPFTLDSYQLINLKNKEDPELGGAECKIISGDLEKIRYGEPILKLEFLSKDKKSSLNLNDYLDEINSLIYLDIDFISVYQNKLFIQCEKENDTNEAYFSLQKSSAVFDLLYDEEKSINSLDEQNKGTNSLFNSDKKSKNEYSYENILQSDKKEKNMNFFNKFDSPIIKDKKLNENDQDYNCKEKDLFFGNYPKNIWDNKQMTSDENSSNNLNVKKSQNSPPQNNSNLNTKYEPSQKSKSTATQKTPLLFPTQLFPPFLFPLNNLQKMQPQINPSLMMQMAKLNPFYLQTFFAMQNIFKFQQLNQKMNDNKDKKNISLNNLNNIKNFNGKNNNNNFETVNNNKESSTNSNTSSSSSKETSPSSNYQAKNTFNANNNNNFNFPNINFGLFNGFNMNNISNFNNININNNNIKNNNNNININKDVKPMTKDDNNSNVEDKKTEENNHHLEQIIFNKQYKEYIPKNHLKDKEKEKEKEKGVDFHTNSTRDYQFKYVSRYIVQIENEKNFPVTKMIIGNNGMLLRKILIENCINYGDHTTKIRLRGRGSGYKEGPKNEESKDPMELCISSLSLSSYLRCSIAIENLLRQVYCQYYIYQCNNYTFEKKNENSNNILNGNKEFKDKNGCPIIKKEILKYQYIVNRYNTLVKEEKRRKKEEELKNANQNIINSDNNNNEYNHV